MDVTESNSVRVSPDTRRIIERVRTGTYPHWSVRQAIDAFAAFYEQHAKPGTLELREPAPETGPRESEQDIETH